MNTDRSEAAFPQVILVMLRQPKMSISEESRSDPYWEFGSFGSTYCHSRNLMNPRRALELNGAQFAFAQGGPAGIRLVHVTPPIRMRIRKKGALAEATWTPAEMPLRYDSSPLLVDAAGQSDCPALLQDIRGVRRSTWLGKFASAFRSRRCPVAGVIGAELLRTYHNWREAHADRIATHYIDALPFHPPHIEADTARRGSYRRNVRC
jgi:hypothetical protein